MFLRFCEYTVVDMLNLILRLLLQQNRSANLYQSRSVWKTMTGAHSTIHSLLCKSQKCGHRAKTRLFSTLDESNHFRTHLFISEGWIHLFKFTNIMCACLYALSHTRIRQLTPHSLSVPPIVCLSFSALLVVNTKLPNRCPQMDFTMELTNSKLNHSFSLYFSSWNQTLAGAKLSLVSWSKTSLP